MVANITLPVIWTWCTCLVAQSAALALQHASHDPHYMSMSSPGYEPASSCWMVSRYAAFFNILRGIFPVEGLVSKGDW